MIKRFEKCDFGPIREHVNQQKDLRKAATLEEKERAMTGRSDDMV